VNHVLLILTGGTGIPLLVFAVARRLVHRHGDQAAADEYLANFRKERAAERAALARRDAELLATAAERMRPTQQQWLEQRLRPNAPKELTR
jgi:hypothetical protein